MRTLIHNYECHSLIQYLFLHFYHSYALYFLDVACVNQVLVLLSSVLPASCLTKSGSLSTNINKNKAIVVGTA